MYLGEAFAECRVQHNLASTIMYLHITTTSSAGDAEWDVSKVSPSKLENR